MGGAAVFVDVFSVRFTADHIRRNTDALKQTFGRGRRTAVGAVRQNPSRKSAPIGRSKMFDIIGYGIFILIHRSRLCRRRKLTAAHHRFDPVFLLIGQLAAVGAEKFNAVIFVRIMTRGDHHTRVRSSLCHQIRDCGRRHNTGKQHIRTRLCQAARGSRLQHTARFARIASNQNKRLFSVFGGKHLRRGTSKRRRKFFRQINARDAANAVCSKQSAHGFSPHNHSSKKNVSSGPFFLDPFTARSVRRPPAAPFPDSEVPLR